MLNKVTIIGNLGQDPQIGQIGRTNAKIAKIGVGVTKRGYTTADGTQVPERTTWFNITLWNKYAEIAEKYLRKGSKVYIEGELLFNDYTTKSGEKRRDVEIGVKELIMLFPNPTSQNTTQHANVTSIPPAMQNAVNKV